MKKGIFIIAMFVALFFSACSTPRIAIMYPEPISASETSVFIGYSFGQNGYSKARTKAIAAAAKEGYTKILAEVVKNEGTAGITVSLVMTK